MNEVYESLAGVYGVVAFMLLAVCIGGTVQGLLTKDDDWKKWASGTVAAVLWPLVVVGILCYGAYRILRDGIVNALTED